jgi:hypothetical protein
MSCGQTVAAFVVRLIGRGIIWFRCRKDDLGKDPECLQSRISPLLLSSLSSTVMARC